MDPPPRPIPPTPRATAEPTTAPGRPQLVSRLVRTDPAGLAVGEPFTLTLDLVNRGNRSVATAPQHRVRRRPASGRRLPLLVVGRWGINKTRVRHHVAHHHAAVTSGYQGAPLEAGLYRL
jgi:hypothetical protein